MGNASDMDNTEVLVVGGGPTGLIAAAALARKGIRVRIVDAACGPSGGSRGKGVQPRTLELLDGFGVAGRLVATGRSRLLLKVHGPDGSTTLIDLSNGAEPTPDSPYARPLVAPQWRMEETLRDLVASHGVQVEFGRRVTGLDADDNGVTVAIEGGDAVRAQWVIGADGGSSTVRRLSGFSFLGETRDTEQMLLADVRLSGVDRDFWHLRPRPDGKKLSLCPVPATDSFVIQAEIGPDDDVDSTLSTFQRLVDEAYGPGVVTLHELLWSSRWRFNQRMVERYRAGRVLLAGDSAHVHAPAGAQGMNTGIHDGLNVGWKLAAVLRGAPQTLIDTYEQERLPIAAAVLGFSRELLGHFVEYRKADSDTMLGLGITYRNGPPAPAYAGDGPHPGDRGPDAVCAWPDGRRVRLFDLQRGGHWTLYRFGGAIDVQGADLVAYTIGVDVRDPDGRARSTYHAADEEFVLIRPDGHVGLRTGDPAAVTEYLAMVTG